MGIHVENDTPQRWLPMHVLVNSLGRFVEYGVGGEKRMNAVVLKPAAEFPPIR